MIIEVVYFLYRWIFCFRIIRSINLYCRNTCNEIMDNRLPVFIGNNAYPSFKNNEVQGELIELANESYYVISNVNEMPPFFMSIVSDSNHWMFISSNGGLTAGRKNADYAIFPYYTDDKITESAEFTGNKSVFLVKRNGKSFLWEPFSGRYEDIYKISRNLYKNYFGNKIIFEEVNHDLELTFRYQWSSSNLFGFIKTSTLINDSQSEVKISVLDGIQNILPYALGSEVQNTTSNLADAYKRSELIKESGLGIYALSAVIADKPEPAEALKANIVWSLGLDNTKYLLSNCQLKSFRQGLPVYDEVDVKAVKGSYFIKSEVVLSAKAEKEWMIIANVNQTQSSIVNISAAIINDKNLYHSVKQDVDFGTRKLIELVASSDGLQLTEDYLRNLRHYSNTMFNIMRGGIFDNNYQMEKLDFIHYLAKANKKILKSQKLILQLLPPVFMLSKLQEVTLHSSDENFERLCMEYLPLKFSRRHGDPSRPWNIFSINTRSEADGSKILDYEGNWRDIFQNWEALAHSFPEFTEGMVYKFLNASTFDGYNPYRITKDGFDWEKIEPDNQWSFIGYWGDHQIIYLLKLLEIIANHYPGKLESLFNKEIFVYANIPYKIKSYKDILVNSKDTIVFDYELDDLAGKKIEELGADGALLCDEKGHIHHVTFLEKLLATLLAKLSNFIPEGGIWMNTQRPEWNDANNALVGNGVSMVTLYYLRRFLHFSRKIFTNSHIKEVNVSAELIVFLNRIADAFDKYRYILKGKISDRDRKLILDDLGQAGSDYRWRIYKHSFSGRKETISLLMLSRFVEMGLDFLDHSIRANKRTDNLYHSYNLMTVKQENEISVSYLNEMLEGQVAVLSSGYLSSGEALDLLNGLRKSKLFREDQNSYLLYPNKNLPGFLEKNNIPGESVSKSELLKKMINNGNSQIVEKDIMGNFHFNGNFRNAGDLSKKLEEISQTEYAPLVEKEKELVLQFFEEIFNHKAFTGRSGTFFGYEGLGSIYWHMVSKLRLAVQEHCLKAITNKESKDIINHFIHHYTEISEGIGVHKHPLQYGAFPTDPYSHTPEGKGVKQPGMTGQVKEDILSRFGELGVLVNGGKLSFHPFLLKKNEFLKQDRPFHFMDVNAEPKQIFLKEGSLGFTYCQVPVVYKLSENESLEILWNNSRVTKFHSLDADEDTSRKIFERTGEVIQIEANISESLFK